MKTRTLKSKKTTLSKQELDWRRRALQDCSQEDVCGIAPYQVLNEMTLFIQGCYPMGVNPLPVLREGFPDYVWQYLDLSKSEGYDEWVRQLTTGIKNSDFFWMCSIYDDCDLWVLAKPKIGSPRIIFGNGFLSDIFDPEDKIFEDVLSRITVKEVYPAYEKKKK